MTKVNCLKCKSEGYLIAKQTISKSIRYQYWYVKHPVDDKIKWCYIGKTLPTEYQKLKPVRESTQTGTQNSTQTEKPDLNPISRKKWTGGDSHKILFQIDLFRFLARLVGPARRWLRTLERTYPEQTLKRVSMSGCKARN